MRELRHKEMNALAQSHIAIERQYPDLNSEKLVFDFPFLNTLDSTALKLFIITYAILPLIINY